MPSYVKPRGGKFGAQVPGRRRGHWRWLGTFETEELAQAAVDRALAVAPRRKRCQRRREIVPPTFGQVLELAAAARDEGMRAFTLTAAFSGLRLFEVAALDVADLVDGRLVVRRGKGGYVNEDSLLYEPGLSALTDFAAGPGPIFRTAAAGEYSRQYVSRLWKPMREAVGFDGTFHSLRHFHACWLLDQGAAIVDVAAQLRHHDRGRLVGEVYGRMLSRQAALGRLEGLR